MDKLRMQSSNGVEDNIMKIAQLFPDCVTETVDERSGQPKHLIDFEKLKQNLSDSVMSERAERYQFTWPDKSKAILLANSPINATLRPCREESVDFDNTQNLYIEGDNLDVLKCLKETYLHKVKMIYIDPPYNTGNDFVYEDDFAQSSEEYLANSGQFDEQGNRMFTNAESNGRFHTDWLNMIYPRLKVARDLLTDDGVIFISIDDNEVENLRKVCDEVFGEDNFVNCIAVKMSEASGVKMNHAKSRFPKIKEYLLFYKKRDFKKFECIDKYPITQWDEENNLFLENFEIEDRKKLEELELKDSNDNKDMELANVILSKARIISICDTLKKYSISEDNKTEWLFKNSYRIFKTAGSSSLAKLVKSLPLTPSQDMASAVSKKGVLFFYITKFNRNTKQPRLQVIFADTNLYKNPCDFWQDIKTTGGIANEGDVNYSNGKKPLKLINRIVKMTTTDHDLILDFFSGSATTAHSVMEMNKEEKSERKFIMVQIDEDLDESLKKATGNNKDTIEEAIDFLDSIGKPHLLTELGKERIRRAGKKIKEESPLTTQDLDTGFRVLKLDSTNMQDIYYSPKDISQADLFSQVDNVKPDRTGEDLLFQVMLELGATLDSKIETTTVAGKTIYNVAEGYLVACFDPDVTDEVVEAIAQMQPAYVVLRDTSMKDDSTATNFEQIFKTYSPDTVTKIL